MTYDMLIIGDEREGIERAISAAQNGLRVAIVVGLNSTPSLDLLRQAADHLAQSRGVTMTAWRTEVARLVRSQTFADHAELECLGIERMSGNARFVSATTVEVSGDGASRVISGMEIVIACGTRSRQPASLCSDGRFVLGVESLLGLNDIPESLIVVGAGETGLAAAFLLAKLGVEVTVVDEHVSLLEVCGMFKGAFDAVQSLNIAFRLGDEAIGTRVRPGLQAAVQLSSGRVLAADVILVCVGREGRTETMNLESVGVGLDERGRLWCDVHGQTWAWRIVAVGDVIGFPRQNELSTNGCLPSMPMSTRRTAEVSRQVSC